MAISGSAFSTFFPPRVAPLRGVSKDDDAERRQLQAELSDMKDQFQRETLSDGFSQIAGEWRENFFQSIRNNADVSTVKETFIILLKRLLQDPTHTPLDENALLGSDGVVYSSQTYHLFLQNAPQDMQDRSPLNPENPTPFTARPHLIAQYLVKWLNAQTNKPASSTTNPADAFRVFQRRSQTYAQKLEEEIKIIHNEAKKANARAERLQPRLDKIDRTVAAQKKIAKLQAEELARKERQTQHREQFAQTIKQNSSEDKLKKIRELYTLLQEDRERNNEEKQAMLCQVEEMRVAMQQKIEAAKKRMSILEQVAPSLEQMITETQVEVKNVKKDHAEVDTLICQTEEVIKKNEEKSDSLLGGIGAVILCAILTIASEGQIVFIPIPGGGIMGGSSVSI